jgi:ketosteroid isomerase-like protein
MGNFTDESQILELIKKWISAANSKDISTVTDMLLDDITIIHADIDPLIGKQQVVKYYEDSFQLFERNFVLESHKIVVSKRAVSGILLSLWQKM